MMKLTAIKTAQTYTLNGMDRLCVVTGDYDDRSGNYPRVDGGNIEQALEAGLKRIRDLEYDVDHFTTENRNLLRRLDEANSLLDAARAKASSDGQCKPTQVVSKIAAIKALRNVSDFGLREAKEVVEFMMQHLGVADNTSRTTDDMMRGHLRAFTNRVVNRYICNQEIARQRLADDRRCPSSISKEDMRV